MRSALCEVANPGRTTPLGVRLYLHFCEPAISDVHTLFKIYIHYLVNGKPLNMQHEYGTTPTTLEYILVHEKIGIDHNISSHLGSFLCRYGRLVTSN